MTDYKLEIEEIRQALKKDWRDLYVAEYTTDYIAQRVIREIEIDIMQFSALTHLIETEKKKARIEELKSLKENFEWGAGIDPIQDRIATLKKGSE